MTTQPFLLASAQPSFPLLAPVADIASNSPIHPLSRSIPDRTVASRESGRPNANAVESSTWEIAFRALQNVVSEKGLLVDRANCEEYSTCTLPGKTTPRCIVFPESRVETQHVLQIASQHRLPWHAISRGKNWGYGDACAATDGQLIIDLRRMDRIVEVNEQLAYAVIEPGVTQGQLAKYLRDTGSRLMLDVTGAGPDASIVGNTLQRGFGHTPYGDHFAHSCNYEVVLPNGDFTRTGFGTIENSQVAHVYPYGIGPVTQGLFSQSQAGVVTRMTIWLMPRPESVVGFGFRVQDEQHLAEVIEILRELRQKEIVRSIVHIANDLRVISTQLPDAWKERAHCHLSDHERRHFAAECGIGAWNAVGGLYGSHKAVAEAMRATRRAFRGLTRVHFFTRNRISALETATPYLGWLSMGRRLQRMTRSVRDVFDLLEGSPSANHLEGARWRAPEHIRDLRHLGLIWIAPVVPLTSQAVREAIDIITLNLQEFHFDPLVTVSPISPRSAICIANINFEKGDASRTEQAADCARITRARLRAAGYPSYRCASISDG